MKKNKRLTAALLVFAMLLLTSIGSVVVFAEEGGAVSSTLETDNSGDTAQAVVSGCDLKKENLVKAEVKQYGFSMLVPKGHLTTIESDSSVFEEVSYSRSYFMEQNCAMQAFTDGDNYCSVTLFVTQLSSLYDYYGDYDKLSKAQQDELVKDAGANGNQNAEFVKINGRSYLQASVTDSSDDSNNVYTQYQFTTVINGEKYELYIQAVNADDADKAVMNEMIKSIKLNGMGIQLNAVDVTLIVVCVILVLAVVCAYFFLFRANEFAKAGINEYDFIGFDLPKSEKDSDEDEDDNDDDEFEDDDDDDETEDDSTQEIAEDSDDDSDDERIIKD